MTCTVEYDLSTGMILGVLSPGLPQGVTLPQDRGVLYLTQDFIDPSANKVDITQTPPVIIAYTPPVDYISQAQNALTASDKTILRCVENSVVVPAAWHTYRQTLRAIVSGSQAGPLPTIPSYPAGT